MHDYLDILDDDLVCEAVEKADLDTGGPYVDPEHKHGRLHKGKLYTQSEGAFLTPAVGRSTNKRYAQSLNFSMPRIHVMIEIHVSLHLYRTIF